MWEPSGAQHSSRWLNRGRVALLFARASFRSTRFRRIACDSHCCDSLSLTFHAAVHAVVWEVRGASCSPLSRRLGFTPDAGPFAPRELEEPLPTSNRPLTPHVAFRAPPRRLQPNGSLLAFASTPIPFKGPLAQSLARLLYPVRQNRPSFPTEGSSLSCERKPTNDPRRLPSYPRPSVPSAGFTDRPP